MLAVFLLYLALRGLNWDAFLISIRRANYGYVVLVVVWSSVTYFFRAMRWRVLLNSQKRIPPFGVFWANMAGYLGNNVLPARAGELIRAGYIARKENLSIAFVLATGITERLVDLITLVVVGATSLLVVNVFPESVQDALWGFAVIAVIGSMFIFFLPLFHGILSRITDALPFLSQSFKSRLNELLRHFVRGIKVVTHVEQLLSFLFFTVLIWFMDGIGIMMLAFALHENLALSQAFLFIAALGLSSAIPSTPGYVGVYQFVAVTVLVPFGIARESALALVLISQALNLLIVSCWGGVGLWIGTRNALA